MTKYNTVAIRQLLSDGLSDETVTVLCFDYFRPVYEGLSTGMSKGQKIQLLIEYCVRQNRIPYLLEAIRGINPAKYAQYESRLTESVPGVATEPSSGSPQARKLASLRRRLAVAERVLAIMEERVDGYGELDISVDLGVNLDEQREKVANLQREIAALEGATN